MNKDVSSAKVLIVDDEPDIRELIALALSRMGIRSKAASGVVNARRYLTEGEFELCLTDMRMPDGDGIELVKHVVEQHNDVPIAVITAHGDMQSAVEALKAGAFDFVSKPVSLPVLRGIVQQALKLRSNEQAASTVSEREEKRQTADLQLVGDSDGIQALNLSVAKMARSQAPVFILGENGSGKELIARLIHAQSSRSNNEFVVLNCSAVEEQHLEAALFGSVSGMRTADGSVTVEDQQGAFQLAEGGTLLLQDIAQIPVNMQVKLFRCLQDKCVYRQGSQKAESMDVRIITSSEVDIVPLLQTGQFREDLYYRIHVIELNVPPLRKHKKDLDALIRFNVNKFAAMEQRHITIDDAALKALQQYDYPGNVTELENILERACALCEADHINVADLTFSAAKSDIPSVVESNLATAKESFVDTNGKSDLDGVLGDVERQVILQALEQTRWNKSAAARKLGINLGALRYRMLKLGIE